MLSNYIAYLLINYIALFISKFSKIVPLLLNMLDILKKTLFPIDIFNDFDYR